MNGTKVSMKHNLTLSTDGLGFWHDEELNRITVIDTDYKSYAVLATCYNKYGSNVIVLTRALGVNQDINDLIYIATEKINFNTNYLTPTRFGSATCGASGIATMHFYWILLFNCVSLFVFTKLWAHSHTQFSMYFKDFLRGMLSKNRINKFYFSKIN